MLLFFRIRRGPGEPQGPEAGRAWCLPPRNPLFLRRRAPRPPNRRGPRRARRGASLHAIPCSFVDWHHVPRAGGARGGPSVVLHSLQPLVPSLTGTTSPGHHGPPAGSAWCLTPRNPLFFRRRAPRPRDIKDRRRARRGASLHAIPCSFVAGHHVSRAGGARGGPGVVPHSLQPLVPSLTGTTSPGHQGPPAGSAWCLTPRNPLFLRRLAPRLLNLRAPGPNAQRPAEKKKALHEFLWDSFLKLSHTF